MCRAPMGTEASLYHLPVVSICVTLRYSVGSKDSRPSPASLALPSRISAYLSVSNSGMFLRQNQCLELLLPRLAPKASL